jgi:hypothetical protein
MDVVNESVRTLNLESELMPPPPARVPYEKAKDPTFNPLAINSIRRSRPAVVCGESTAGATPSKAVVSTHVTDIATSYAAAAAAVSKTTPKTDENKRILSSSDPVIREQVEAQKATLKLQGRVQRLLSMGPTREEQREYRTQHKRELRARAKLFAREHDALMRRLQDVGQYSDKGLELWELLMIEFALQHDNVGSSGQMRTRYLEQLFAARLKEHVPRQHGVGRLTELRQVLLKFSDVRALALTRLRHAKYFCADFLSGGYRIEMLIPSPDESLMALMERSNSESLGRRGVGRWASAKPGGGAYALRQAKVKGRIYPVPTRMLCRAASSHVLMC